MSQSLKHLPIKRTMVNSVEKIPYERDQHYNPKTEAKKLVKGKSHEGAESKESTSLDALSAILKGGINKNKMGEVVSTLFDGNKLEETMSKVGLKKDGASGSYEEYGEYKGYTGSVSYSVDFNSNQRSFDKSFVDGFSEKGLNVGSAEFSLMYDGKSKKYDAYVGFNQLGGKLDSESSEALDQPFMASTIQKDYLSKITDRFSHLRKSGIDINLHLRGSSDNMMFARGLDGDISSIEHHNLTSSLEVNREDAFTRYNREDIESDHIGNVSKESEWSDSIHNTLNDVNRSLRSGESKRALFLLRTGVHEGISSEDIYSADSSLSNHPTFHAIDTSAHFQENGLKLSDILSMGDKRGSNEYMALINTGQETSKSPPLIATGKSVSDYAETQILNKGLETGVIDTKSTLGKDAESFSKSLVKKYSNTDLNSGALRHKGSLEGDGYNSAATQDAFRTLLRGAITKNGVSDLDPHKSASFGSSLLSTVSKSAEMDSKARFNQDDKDLLTDSFDFLGNIGLLQKVDTKNVFKKNEFSILDTVRKNSNKEEYNNMFRNAVSQSTVFHASNTSEDLRMTKYMHHIHDSGGSFAEKKGSFNEVLSLNKNARDIFSDPREAGSAVLNSWINFSGDSYVGSFLGTHGSNIVNGSPNDDNRLNNDVPASIVNGMKSVYRYTQSKQVTNPELSRHLDGDVYRGIIAPRGSTLRSGVMSMTSLPGVALGFATGVKSEGQAREGGAMIGDELPTGHYTPDSSYFNTFNDVSFLGVKTPRDSFHGISNNDMVIMKSKGIKSKKNVIAILGKDGLGDMKKNYSPSIRMLGHEENEIIVSV